MCEQCGNGCLCTWIEKDYLDLIKEEVDKKDQQSCIEAVALLRLMGGGYYEHLIESYIKNYGKDISESKDHDYYYTAFGRMMLDMANDWKKPNLNWDMLDAEYSSRWQQVQAMSYHHMSVPVFLRALSFIIKPAKVMVMRTTTWSPLKGHLLDVTTDDRIWQQFLNFVDKWPSSDGPYKCGCGGESQASLWDFPGVKLALLSPAVLLRSLFAQETTSPIALDLDGDGVESTNL